MTQELSRASLVAENRANNAGKQAVRAEAAYCLYARKSSEDDERQALSIDSQISEMTDLATREGLNIVETRRESHSAKSSGERPEFNKLMNDIDKGAFNAILTWAPDRLSRNGGDLGRLVDLMDKGRLIEIRTHSQRFTDSPNEKFLLMILGSQAKLENDNRGVNVRRGLKSKVEMGWRPGLPPLGYLNEHSANRGQNRIFVDDERAPVIRKLFEMVAQKEARGRALHAYLKEIGFVTRTGRPVTLSSIYLILKNPFYHGMFEFPRKSGRWYKGAHEPLVAKELFDRVQESLSTPVRPEYGQKEFQFISMFRCGTCGSGFTAEEKVKRNKTNEAVHRYVYYRCTRSRDKDCKEPPIGEKALTDEVLKIIDAIDIDKIGVEKRAVEDAEKLKALAAMFGQKDLKVSAADVDVRAYARHVLEHGSRDEKRKILENIKGAVVIHDRTLKMTT